MMQGGIEAVHQNNQRKAQTVYDAIANSDGFYQNPVDPAAQSLMNVPFTIPSNADLEKEFISKAAAAGLVRPLQWMLETERSQCWAEKAFLAPGQPRWSSCVVQVQLKGHRSVGGMRASIYNSMPQDGVQFLADFMADFQRTHS
jgi:phosphoserine aminotransferase